ncbi:MAG: ribosome maturation factor RimP [bacterium]|nr:ribosome maturation factor RimP [bacterium]
MPKPEPQELESWIIPLVEDMGLELVDLEFAREPKGFILRVYIDRPQGGVTIDDCQAVSEQLNFRLDTIEEYKRYNISLVEVSSPGLDRKLDSEKDFLRERGKQIRVIVKEPIGKQNTFSGILKDYRNGQVLLIEQKSNRAIELAIENIAVAQLEVDWRTLFRKK